MSLILGNTDINRLYLGSNEINLAYLGSDIVYQTENLGPELIVNGTFESPDTAWVKVNSTVSGGSGNLDGATFSNSLLWQNILTNGLTYFVTFDVVSNNDTGSMVIINNNGLVLFNIPNGLGSHSFTFTHSISNGNFLFRARVGGVYSIDNVSVRQVL